MKKRQERDLLMIILLAVLKRKKSALRKIRSVRKRLSISKKNCLRRQQLSQTSREKLEERFS